MRNFVIAALAGALIVIISASLPSLAGENAGLQAVAYPVAVALFIPYVCFMLPAVLDGGREMTALYALFAALSILTVFYIAESSARGYGRMRLLVLEGALVCMMSLSFAVFMISLGITNTAILSFPIAIAVLIYILAALVEIVPPEGVGAESNANEAPTSSNHIEYIPEPEESPVSEEVPEAIDYSDIILLDAEDTGESYGAIVVSDEDESPAYEAIAVSEDDDNEAIAAIDKPSSISDDVITAAQISQNDEEIEEGAIVVDEDSVIEEKALYFETVETEEIPAIAIDSEDELAAIQAISLDNTESISTASVSSFFSDDAEEVNALLIDEAEETSVDAILVNVEESEDWPAIIKEEDKPEELPVSVVEESEDEVLPVAVIDAEEATVVPVIVDSAEESQMLIIEEEDIPETEPATQLPDEVYEEIAMDAEETSAVPAPPVLSVSTSLSVPTAPSITNTAHLSAPSAPVLTNTAKLVEESVYTAPRWEDDDFWSTFYIAGQDNLQLEDGVYYMNLSINGNYSGTITTQIDNGEVSILTSDLRVFVEGAVTDEAYDRIFANVGEYISLDYLDSIGVVTSFDSADYAIDIQFSTIDMPIQIISIQDTGWRSRMNRPISGAEELKPATFVLSSDFSLEAGFDFLPFNRFTDTLDFTFSSSNQFRLLDVYGSFNYYFYFGLDYFRFNFGSYRFYTDFEDEMIRLSWGNISSTLLSPRGTGFGIRFDKSFSYAPEGAKRKSHIDRLISIEKESEVIIYNEGREIFNETLDPGNYRLQDFVLYTGANRIRIVITPLDGSPSRELEMDVMYSSSLLAVGEMYYGASLSFGRETAVASEDRRAALSIPLWGNRKLIYDPRNFVASGYLNAGITDSLTMNTSLAVQSIPTELSPLRLDSKLAVELTNANILGTTRYNLNLTESSAENGSWTIPRIYARIGHQFDIDTRALSSISLTATYESPYESITDGAHYLSASMSLGGYVGIMNWSAYISGGMYTDQIDRFTYSASLSASMTLSNYFWISGSLNLNGQGIDSPRVSGSIYASFRFGRTSISASTSNFRTVSARINTGDNRNTFNASIYASRPEDFSTYNLSADYGYSGNLLDFDIDLDAPLSFQQAHGSIEVSTSTVFADGAFTMASSIPSNFLLIRQKGALRGNDISVGSIGSSYSQDVPRIFGTAMYRLPSTRSTGLTLYSMNDNSFGNMKYFDINVPHTDRFGFVYTLYAENEYSASAVVTLPNGMIWTNGSSPLYRYHIEDNNVILENTDEYLFTDSDGRFSISSLAPGDYAFDVRDGSDWYLGMFSISDDEQHVNDIQIMTQIDAEDSLVLPSPYSQALEFEMQDYITAEEFWNMLYPWFGEAV